MVWDVWMGLNRDFDCFGFIVFLMIERVRRFEDLIGVLSQSIEFTFD